MNLNPLPYSTPTRQPSIPLHTHSARPPYSTPTLPDPLTPHPLFPSPILHTHSPRPPYSTPTLPVPHTPHPLVNLPHCSTDTGISISNEVDQQTLSIRGEVDR
ncbi:hypothetical protein Pcinc_006563 [Petrolisthes cinctipes]|uniref:Uncharacterized protein n=1 Tax=Petrolisthes cinctipes TaxID=88211 RepID=A0AAE1GCR3_PETCI|nr:hypothetical protein Pcinc_006563 [Petrolisthes cinctipes]